MIKIFLICLLFNFSNADFLFETNCKNNNNLNDCINDFGCGWCNVTKINKNISNNTVYYTEKVINTCNQIHFCPLNANNSCIIKNNYYYNFNCFLSYFILYIFFIFGYLLIWIFFIYALNISNSYKNIYKLFMGFLILTGFIFLFYDSLVFSIYFFLLLTISPFISIVYCMNKSKKIYININI